MERWNVVSLLSYRLPFIVMHFIFRRYNWNAFIFLFPLLHLTNFDPNKQSLLVAQSFDKLERYIIKYPIYLEIFNQRFE